MDDAEVQEIEELEDFIADEEERKLINDDYDE